MLLQTFRDLEFEPVVMRGQPARRTVRHFGYTYDFDSWRLTRTDPVPDYLSEMRARCAEMAGIDPASFEQALVTRYPLGATIGWHRDSRAFGTVVGGVSLGSDCVMRFQRRAAGVNGGSSSSHWLGARPTCCPAPPGGCGSTASRPWLGNGTRSPSGL